MKDKIARLRSELEQAQFEVADATNLRAFDAAKRRVEYCRRLLERLDPKHRKED